ncbi:hypothetical protein SETIT_7G129600v2 [Setaria italica]|uniref:Uncharacterized protein n=3 Tax=Setaria italica TaxID=4555 RepID=K3Y690_SETIT|nr:uncharacterized protein LOC101761685 isoform X1 [Setaria italica]RCV34023.1 hypothetical protein SETIT_7G129600v2 [Setaria italica]
MKIDDERPYQSHIFQELPSNGNPKLDFETERQSKHKFLADKMVEQTNQSEHSFLKGEHQNGGKTGQTCIEDYSYDKDVVEIKLPDTILSSNYGGHFIKDVCIDEGVLPDKKTSTEKLVDQKVSINFDSSEDTNGDLGEEIRADSTKTALELKSHIVILPVMCATDGNTGEQISLCKEHDLEGNNTAPISTDSNDEKSNPKQSLHEDAQGGQQVGSVISESNENLEPFFNGEAAHQDSFNGCHETGIGIASETSNIIHSDLPAESAAADFAVAIPDSTALDKGASNQVNHYNPFIAYGSLDETWEPNYSLPTIVDAASVAPICPVEKTDSFSDLVNRALEGFDPIEIDEAIIEENRSDSVEASTSTLDVQASEQCNDKRESPTDDVKTDVTQETGIAAVTTSLSTSNGESSDVKSENGKKCEIDNAQDINDFNPRDVEVGTKRSEDITDSKSSPLVQTESVVQQNGPDSAKVTAQTVIRNPFESSFSGPSITSGPLTPSGHIPYSGNISLRSESSTTSTRSFAFPVLQNEWNSSPVKMAKADRRRLREDRGWGYRILCCKF